MIEQFTVSAPAKINLALHVTGKRSDGYHDLDSLVVFARAGDELSVSVSGQDQFTITGRFGNLLSVNEDNLVMRAVKRVRDVLPQSVPRGLSIELKKNLPIASGIGGGSADAAAMLGLLQHINRHFKLPKLGNDLVHRIAAELGADVPMCLDPKPKHILGPGDTFSKIQNLPEFYMVLVNPLIGVATPEIFKVLQWRENSPMPEFGKGWATLDDLVEFLSHTRNDLTAPASQLVPEIARTLKSMSSLPDCKLARMSGSGATVFGVFATQSAAKSAQVELCLEYPDYWIEALSAYHTGLFES